MTYHRQGGQERRRLEVGAVRMALPAHPDNPLRLVVVKGFGKEPLLLITNLLDASVERIVQSFDALERDMSFRFLKEGYHLEDVRLLTWDGLKNLVALLLAVFFFVSVELGQKLRLNLLLKKIYEKAKRLFGIPPFKHYARAVSLYALLVCAQKGLNLGPPYAHQSLPHPSLFPDP